MNGNDRNSPDPAADDSCRRSESRALVEKLLQERERVLRLLCEAGEVIPGQEHSRSAVSRLCDVLIDYLAASHFALLQRVSGDEERRSLLAREGQRAYPRLLESTDAALEFNDRFGSVPQAGAMPPLREALSTLGERLTERFEIEDRLIAALVASENDSGAPAADA